MSYPLGAKRIAEVEITFSQGKHGHIRLRSFPQRSQILQRRKRCGGVGSGALDHLLERQPEQQELG